MRKTITFLIMLMFLLFANSGNMHAQNKTLTAKEVIDKSNDLMRGKSSYSEITITITRPKWARTITSRSWAKGTDYSLLYILSPAKEKGQVFLKREKDMWNWIPSIDRMIKIPPSMMMQSWMGSDLTNDDLVKESSIVEDYDHKIIGEETLQGYECYKIELTPYEDAPVVWGKIISWISKKGFMPLKNEFYDEDEFLVKTETLSKIKDVGDRIMPTFYEIIPEDKEGQKTTLEFTNIKFNVDIQDDFFSIQNMKKIH